jgi:hypothetical protein
MMIGIGTPSSHNRIERPMRISLSGYAGLQTGRDFLNLVLPGAIAQAAALDGGETGGERANQERGGEP